MKKEFFLIEEEIKEERFAVLREEIRNLTGYLPVYVMMSTQNHPFVKIAAVVLLAIGVIISKRNRRHEMK